MAEKKYYTVWKGVNPGVYDSWTDCQLQIKGFKGALYKSFNTREEAEHAFASPAYEFLNPSGRKKSGSIEKKQECNLYLRTGEQIFHFGPMYGTNNIGEFLAIVHGLALLKQKNLDMPIYSDSRNAQLWVKQKKCKTNLVRNAKTEELFRYIERAENWLKNNSYSTPILKWQTDQWGEIPADFGRK